MLYSVPLSNSASLGQAQTDAIRNITGSFNPSAPSGQIQPSGAFSTYANSSEERGGNHMGGRVVFDASKEVPTANENRPINKSVLICIKY